LSSINTPLVNILARRTLCFDLSIACRSLMLCLITFTHLFNDLFIWVQWVYTVGSIWWP